MENDNIPEVNMKMDVIRPFQFEPIPNRESRQFEDSDFNPSSEISDESESEFEEYLDDINYTETAIKAMTEIQVADDGGDEMTLMEYNGYRYPNFGSTALENLKSFKFQPDDVVICAFPKSGTHWVWEMTRLLLAGTIDRDSVSKMVRMLEFATEDMHKILSVPRIFNSHLLYRHLPMDIEKSKPKIIYITRNPKDVLVSHYSFITKLPFYNYTGSWNNYVKPAVLGKLDYGSWFDYILDWEQVVRSHTELSILSLNYEDITEDPLREATKLSHFLGVQRNSEFIQKVCDHCAFSNQVDIKTEFKAVYRKGEVGDWKNWFTGAQSEWFDKLYKEKMGSCPVRFRYILNKDHNA